MAAFSVIPGPTLYFVTTLNYGIHAFAKMMTTTLK